LRAEDILPDDASQGEFEGVLVRKGSVAAFLGNAKILTDPARSAEAHALARRHIAEALPALRAVGLFDILQIRDEGLRAWVDAAQNL
jgi:hypothetical protein